MTTPGKIVANFLLLFIAFLFAKPTYAQLQFVENKGQWDSSISFKGILDRGAFALTKSGGYKMLLEDTADLEAIHNYFHGESYIHSSSNSISAAAPSKLQERSTSSTNNDLILHSHMYEVKFLNANPHPQAIVERQLDTYNNYFIGNDKKQWASGCKIYLAVTFKNIYPNIDVRYYTNNGQLKYDLIVNPGGDPKNISMYFDGVNDLKVKAGELHVKTSVDEVKELAPYSYQGTENGRKELDCKYDVKDNVVRFKIADDYSKTVPLIIDPTLVFSSFSGSKADNWGYTATFDNAGNFYSGGIVFGNGFPVTPGAYQQSFKGGNNATGEGQQGVDQQGFDMAILKFSTNGSKLLFATMIGGSGNEQPHSMVVDNDGNLVIAGRTTSSDYPTMPPNKLGNGGGQDIVISKLNSTGTQLLGSLRIGGSADDGVNIRTKDVGPGLDGLRRNYGDDARSEVIVDAANNIYLASCTQSTDFPLTNPLQRNNNGGANNQDAVLMKLNSSLTTPLFSTYLGGSGDDAAYILDIDPLTNDIYVAGATASTNFPGNRSGAVSPNFLGGPCDGFITVISNDGSQQKQTTYIGTNAADQLYGIQFDKYGYPYINGTTEGTITPINSVFNSNNNQTGGKQFIAKLQPDLSQYIYLSAFGPTVPYPNISPTAFLVDRCQNVYVAGWGGGLDGYNSAPGLYDNNGNGGYPNSGTTGLTVQTSPDGQPPLKSTTDGSDFYFFVLERNAQSQLYGSFFGQNDRAGRTTPDHVDGGTSRFDKNGIIYEAICANCGGGTTFPTTPGVYSPNNAALATGSGYSCNMAAIKIAMNLSGVAASVKAEINGVANHTNGCVPLTVAFVDTIAKAKQYVWNFGDGTPNLIASDSITHIFTKVGTFVTSLVAIDSSTCNIADTVYISIRVGNNVVSPDFVPTKIGDCQSLTYQFANTTTATDPIYNASTFLWNYGDGSDPEIAGFTTTTHAFPSAGTYNVSLIVNDSTFCNVPDTVTKTIVLTPNVKAQISTPAIGCVPYTAVIQNTSIGGTSFEWDFGDGQTSTSTNPTIDHLYNNIGTYTIRLIAFDPSTCNKVDTTYFTLSVVGKPTAGFTFSPDPSTPNTPTQFNNTSVGATRYGWSFGDGSTSLLTDPSYQFNATDTFYVCLEATNAAGCADTVCKDVPEIVVPLLDVPKAFTPEKFGTNAVIKVVGFGIEKMDWKIYNRWGQLVFESTQKNDGWDGTYKGTLQPMDVYTYTLEVQFSNGKNYRKTGDITLLR